MGEKCVRLEPIFALLDDIALAQHDMLIPPAGVDFSEEIMGVHSGGTTINCLA